MRCYVKNAQNTSGNESMIEKWEEYTGEACPEDCSNVYCHNKLDDDNKCGAHVFKCDKYGIPSENYKRYIVPLCKECNNFYNIHVMEIGDESLLVPLSELE